MGVSVNFGFEGMSKNRNLNKARTNKNDEFYTLYEDIENELQHYKSKFKNKVVFCNCDDYRKSNFVKFFRDNFADYGLKKLVATHYVDNTVDIFDLDKVSESYCYTFDGINESVSTLNGDGDFRSKESVKILEEADIVVTNPPFSYFKEFLGQLVKYNKRFLIIGNMNALLYKETLRQLIDHKMWFSKSLKSHHLSFATPNTNELTKITVQWFTNMEVDGNYEDIPLTMKYDDKLYPKYDNFDAIEVSAIKDIPYDYDGLMGVPITFIYRYNPNQFDIVGGFNNTNIATKEEDGFVMSTELTITSTGGTRKWNGPSVNGKPLFKRLIIRRRKNG